MEKGHIVSKDDVIAKLKDDGDFDRLRLQIIRRLKDNEEIRDKIVSVVRQSTVLNRPASENMKPRQLSDSIYEEIRGEVMGHISEGLWGIITSPDGMKTEIRDTVQSVYRRLVDPRGPQVEQSEMQLMASKQEHANGDSCAVPSGENNSVFNGEPKEPPGFTLASGHLDRNGWCHKEQQPPSQEKRSSYEDLKDSQVLSHSLTSGDANMPAERGKFSDDSDDDPPLPPGFS